MSSNQPTDFDEVSQEDIADPSSMRVDVVVQKGAVLVLPIDAPVPSELSSLPFPTGSLLNRLAALNAEPEGEAGFAFVPVSGAELMHLERAWRLLTVAKRVFVLFELPGARYDVMFTQASRQIGLRRLDWPEVAEAFASKALSAQRAKDATPWVAEAGVPSQGGARRMPRGLRVDEDQLEVPPHEDS